MNPKNRSNKRFIPLSPFFLRGVKGDPSPKQCRFPTMSKIIYPTLDLFLYDLRDGLGEDLATITQNRANFQAKLPTDLHKSLFDLDGDFESEYTPMLGSPGIANFPKNNQPDEGCYYPVRLGDTYGLLMSCSAKNSVEPQPLTIFKRLKNYLTDTLQNQPANIGQTWFLSGQLPNPLETHPEEIAKTCYKHLIPDGNWQQDYRGEGRFQGGYIFELWRYQLLIKDKKEQIPPQTKEQQPQEPPTIQEIQETQHVIIALYPNLDAMEAAAKYSSNHWMRLFSYRAKILWAYGQSRYLKQKIKQYFVSIQQRLAEIENASQTRPKLQQIQRILEKAQQIQSQYVIDLIKFEYQVKTLEVNRENYQKRLKLIREEAEPQSSPLILPGLSSLVVSSDLNFLEQFSDVVAQKYWQQLQKDYESFSPGKQLLESLMNAIASLRVLVETDQAQRDRTFQNSVAIWGIGLAAGSIVASISAQFPIVVVPTVAANQENDAAQHPLSPYLSELGIKDPWLTPAISLTMTLGSTLIFALIIWVIIKLWERLFEKRRFNKT